MLPMYVNCNYVSRNETSGFAWCTCNILLYFIIKKQEKIFKIFKIHLHHFHGFMSIPSLSRFNNNNNTSKFVNSPSTANLRHNKFIF